MTIDTKFPVIAGVPITTDDDGRFSLNALHKASGGELHKAPAQWMRLKQAQELLSELSDMQICTSPINSVKGNRSDGTEQGTYAHKLLAISYAGWVSPAFQLRVNQTFLDYKSGKIGAPQDLSNPEFLRQTLLGYTEKVLEQQKVIEEQKPKVEFADRVAVAPDAISTGKAAKILNTGRNRLMAKLRHIHWTTKRNEPMQRVIEAGYMDVKIGSFEHPSHGLTQSVTPLITGKGLKRLTELLVA